MKPSLSHQQPGGQTALGVPDVRQGQVQDNPARGDGGAVRDSLSQRGAGEGGRCGESHGDILHTGHQQRR